MKSRQQIDWLACAEQQSWFDRHKSAQADGLRFAQFQEFLSASLYVYFASFSSQKKTKRTALEADIHYRDKPVERQDEAEQARFNRQQEMRLFKLFDTKNDHVLDREEFGALCSKWLHAVYRPSCGLVVVDVQNDFIDGSLAVINGPAGQDGAEVVPVINDLIDHWQQCCGAGATIAYTQDWHPPDHIGFHANLHMRKYTLKETSRRPDDNHCPPGDSAQVGQEAALDFIDQPGLADQARTTPPPANNENNDNNTGNQFKHKKFVAKAKVFDTVLFDDGRLQQKLWPTHCVQNSWGAQLHPKLRQVPDAIHIQKGTLSHVDAYSAFWDNMRLNETGLRQELVSKKVNELFFCGLALDFCVAASALDAAKAGFVTFVIADACRGIDEQEIEARKRELLDNGVFIVQSCHVKDYLMMQQHRGCVVDGGGLSLDSDFVKAVAFRKALLSA